MVSRFDLLWIGQFNMFLDPFFEGIMNLAMKMLDCVCGTCYIQNIDWGRRSRLGDLLRSIWLKVVLDLNSQGILNLKEGNLKFLLCIQIWQNWWFKQKEQVGWPLLIHFIESDFKPKFQGDSESEEGILKFQLSDPIWQNNWWMLKRGFDDLLQYHSFK